jgi:hypothetical protein
MMAPWWQRYTQSRIRNESRTPFVVICHPVVMALDRFVLVFIVNLHSNRLLSGELHRIAIATTTTRFNNKNNNSNKNNCRRRP